MGAIPRSGAKRRQVGLALLAFTLASGPDVLQGASPAPSADSAEVVVEGYSAPDNPQEFEWMVENHGKVPIVRFRTQHFLGKLTVPPHGWIRSKMTGNIGEHQVRETGILEFSVEKRPGGIFPNGRQAFRLRLDPTWTRALTRATVEVEFADGRIVEIPNVYCPAKAPFLRDNYPVVGLGSIFVIFIIAQAARNRRKAKATPPAPSMSP
jgi:hypothetical protein